MTHITLTPVQPVPITLTPVQSASPTPVDAADPPFARIKRTYADFQAVKDAFANLRRAESEQTVNVWVCERHERGEANKARAPSSERVRR
jgi:hypothetical protein